VQGKLTELAAVYAKAVGCTFEEAMFYFSAFHKKDQKTKELMFNPDGTAMMHGKSDPYLLTGKWLMTTYGRAKKETEPYLEGENDAIPE
jgi:hypothetical protein